jgi:uncharacterized glyoxalase superfamily protein PhnB
VWVTISAIQPELWVERPTTAISFYQAAFGAEVVHHVGAGASVTSPIGDEHGWRLGRIADPAGQEWEIGTPLGPWPPSAAAGGSR